MQADRKMEPWMLEREHALVARIARAIMPAWGVDALLPHNHILGVIAERLRDLSVTMRGELREEAARREAEAMELGRAPVSSGDTPQGERKGPESAAELTADDVEWVVNDNAELGVKIGNKFFWLYKGHSLVYEDPRHEDDGRLMMWRHVGKREFAECCHPVNYADPTKIGTVSVMDGRKWASIPAPSASNSAANLRKGPESAAADMLYVKAPPTSIASFIPVGFTLADVRDAQSPMRNAAKKLRVEGYPATALRLSASKSASSRSAARRQRRADDQARQPAC